MAPNLDYPASVGALCSSSIGGRSISLDGSLYYYYSGRFYLVPVGRCMDKPLVEEQYDDDRFNEENESSAQETDMWRDRLS